MKSKYVKQIQSLSARQWRWLPIACARLLAAQIRIKLKQQSWLRKKLSYQSSVYAHHSRPAGATPGTATELFEAVRLAARLQFWATDCLPRSIVLADMLNARGYSAQLKLGVSTAGGHLASHAWIEVDGVMIGEPDSVKQEFVEFAKPQTK